MNRRVVALIALVASLVAGRAGAEDPIAYISEIQRKGTGAALVRHAGESESRAAQPLLPLRRGDEIRVSGDVQIVLLYHMANGTRNVTRANSPFIVRPAPTVAAGERLRLLVSTVGQVLMSENPPPSHKQLVVRNADANGSGIVLVSPRATRLLSGPAEFEWSGDATRRYTVRLRGPGGVAWQAKDVPRGSFPYPASAPRLVPGEYVWEVETPGHPAQDSSFEILAKPEAQRVSEALDEVSRAPGTAYSRGTVPLMRAALLFDQGLYADARRELLDAIARRPDEPSYYMFLACVYRRVGLPHAAADAAHRARVLSGID